MLKPEHYIPSFTVDRLNIIAKALLEECNSTDEDLQSPFDSNFSLGCTRFDRQKNRLKKLALEYPWLTIVNPSNALIMAIDGAPFRFTRDSYISPQKRAATTISEDETIQLIKYSEQYQTTFEFENQDDFTNVDLKWRFFIDIMENPDDHERDYNISLIGSNGSNQIICKWIFNDNGTSAKLSSVDDDLAKPIELSPAKTQLPKDAADSVKDNDSSN